MLKAQLTDIQEMLKLWVVVCAQERLNDVADRCYTLIERLDNFIGGNTKPPETSGI